jgi:protein-disulfide isomerase
MLPPPVADTSATGEARPVTLQLRAAEHALGDPAAPIVIVEFADLQCPFCKDFQETTFPTLETSYIKTGKARFVVRDLPLPIHPYARPAAEAARCAGEQGKYWELRNALLIESAPPSAASISAIAAGAHLEMREFEECQSQHKFTPDIGAEESEAEHLGIRGTPTFLIGRLQEGKVLGTVIQGNRGIDVFRQEIDRLLNEGAVRTVSPVGPNPTSLSPKEKPI